MEIMEIVKFYKLGGWFMHPILFVFAAGLAIALERFFYLVKTNRATNKMWSQLAPMFKANDLQRVLKLVENLNSPLAMVLGYGLAKHNANKKREVVESAMQEGMMDAMPDLVKRTHYLSTFANIATLLGLLGTIVGLIQAFTAVSTAEASEKANLLSASISVAMNTTAFGLIAAIPLLLIHSYLVTKTAKIVDNLEKAALKALNLMIRD